MSSSETDNKLDFLIREEKPDGTIHVRPRFDFPLNSIFSYSTIFIIYNYIVDSIIL
jgi:hypothetical protein